MVVVCRTFSWVSRAVFSYVTLASCSSACGAVAPELTGAVAARARTALGPSSQLACVGITTVICALLCGEGELESLEDEGKRKGRRKRGEEARTGERGMGGGGGEECQLCKAIFSVNILTCGLPQSQASFPSRIPLPQTGSPTVMVVFTSSSAFLTILRWTVSFISYSYIAIVEPLKTYFIKWFFQGQ